MLCPLIPGGPEAIIGLSQIEKEKLKMTNKIIMVIEAILGISAIILLLISMFGNLQTNLPLTCALGCTALSGVINVICLVRKNKTAKR